MPASLFIALKKLLKILLHSRILNYKLEYLHAVTGNITDSNESFHSYNILRRGIAEMASTGKKYKSGEVF